MGLYIDFQFPYLGGSPDSIALTDMLQTRELIEIKCPFKF